MILVLGKNGQVGSALTALLGDKAIACDADEIDLNAAGVTSKLEAWRNRHPSIDTLINAAAYTQVDKAESERELAMRINAEAVGEIASWCATHGITLVHYSTDYVFDGSGAHAREESEPTAPLSIYGQSKLEGEKLVAQSGARHLIFRTSWVYDAMGKNFLNTMRRLFRERESISVVADQVGAPTYAPHLAQATLQALTQAQSQVNFPSGIYHLCGSGEASWYDFAKAILALAQAHESGIKCVQIQPITTAAYPTAARRPLNSRLDCRKAKDILKVALPQWQDALSECYESIRLRH